VSTPSYMACNTPSLEDFAGSSDLFGLDYGFIMDDVEQLLSMKTADGANFQPFRYIENPTVFEFEDVIQYTDGKKLEIMVNCDTVLIRLYVRSVMQQIFDVYSLEKFDILQLYITC